MNIPQIVKDHFGVEDIALVDWFRIENKRGKDLRALIVEEIRFRQAEDRTGMPFLEKFSIRRNIADVFNLAKVEPTQPLIKFVCARMVEGNEVGFVAKHLPSQTESISYSPSFKLEIPTVPNDLLSKTGVIFSGITTTSERDRLAQIGRGLRTPSNITVHYDGLEYLIEEHKKASEEFQKYLNKGNEIGLNAYVARLASLEAAIATASK